MESGPHFSFFSAESRPHFLFSWELNLFLLFAIFLGGVSEGEAEDVAGPASEPIDAEARVRAPARSFASLDVLNLSKLFQSRPRLMRSVPHILRGGFRLALRVAFQEILAGVETNSEARAVRGWKLLLVLPRMLLWRPPRGGTVSRKKLEARIRQFQEGDWISLLRQSTVASEQGQNRAVRQRRRNQDEEAARGSPRSLVGADGGALRRPPSSGRREPCSWQSRHIGSSDRS